MDKQEKFIRGVLKAIERKGKNACLYDMVSGEVCIVADWNDQGLDKIEEIISRHENEYNTLALFWDEIATCDMCGKAVCKEKIQ